jgi:hypothetical protein
MSNPPRNGNRWRMAGSADGPSLGRDTEGKPAKGREHCGTRSARNATNRALWCHLARFLLPKEEIVPLSGTAALDMNQLGIALPTER